MDLRTMIGQLLQTIDLMLEERAQARPVPRLDKEDYSLGPCC